MTKCGLIAYDYEKKKLKLKLYTEKGTDKPKGDGLCTYIKVSPYTYIKVSWHTYIKVS